MKKSDGERAFATLWHLLAPEQPQPEQEYRFTPTRRWRFDFAWPVQRVAVEIDGGQWKPGGGRHSSDVDREKLNEAAASGWRVLHFSPRQLTTNPQHVVEIVQRALQFQE